MPIIHVFKTVIAHAIFIFNWWKMIVFMENQYLSEVTIYLRIIWITENLPQIPSTTPAGLGWA